MSNDPSFELVVHVGDGKTGTSAIQGALRSRQAELERQGTGYLGLMLEHAPEQKYAWQRANRIEQFHALPPDQAAAELADILRSSIAHARARGLRRLVLSNETLLGRSEATIRALRMLADEGAGIRVVAYLRRHDGWARSAYVQWGLKHKTYEGPLRSFRQWAAKRRFKVYPKLEPWQAALGDGLVVRNFDAIADVAADFLQLLGLDTTGMAPQRRNEEPSFNEMALRAMFNDQVAGRVAPLRFNQLFDAGNLDFTRRPSQWLRELLPAPDDLAALAADCADDRERLDALLVAQGQPPLQDGPLRHDQPAIDAEAMLGVLFQIIVRQSLRLEQLERALSANPAAALPAVAAARAGASLPAEEGIAPDPGVVAALAPALGYFGPHAGDRLEASVGFAVRELQLRVEEDKPTFLNLRGMELLRGGKPIRLEPGSYEVSQSSVAGNDPRNGADSLLRQAGIHTAAEPSPWWRVAFKEPLAVDALRISNRSDGWGSRSRTLKIDVVDAAGEARCLHDGMSRHAVMACLAAASRAAGMAGPPALPGDPAQAAATRQDLLRRIAARLRSGELALAAVHWRDTIPLVDAWGRSGAPGDDEWTVLAGFLLAQQQAKGGVSLKSFSLLLKSETRLRRLQQEINDLAAAAGLGSFMLTRHGLKPAGVLRRDPGRFLDHLKAVVGALDSLGRDPVLAYGTLLGAVREGEFIAHDDDIDILYRAHGRTRPEVEAELAGVKEALRERGYRVVDLLPNSLNMHVIDPAHGAVIDVFPCWEEEGLLQMHMESMKVRGIDAALVYPASQVELMGSPFPAPARPADYLKQRYGEKWMVSDQFFEWPWSLDREVAA